MYKIEENLKKRRGGGIISEVLKRSFLNTCLGGSNNKQISTESQTALTEHKKTSAMQPINSKSRFTLKKKNADALDVNLSLFTCCRLHLVASFKALYK